MPGTGIFPGGSHDVLLKNWLIHAPLPLVVYRTRCNTRGNHMRPNTTQKLVRIWWLHIGRPSATNHAGPCTTSTFFPRFFPWIAESFDAVYSDARAMISSHQRPSSRLCHTDRRRPARCVLPARSEDLTLPQSLGICLCTKGMSCGIYYYRGLDDEMLGRGELISCDRLRGSRLLGVGG